MRFAVLLLTLPALAQTPIQSPWEGVPDGFRNLPIGKLQIPPSAAHWRTRRPAIEKTFRATPCHLPPLRLFPQSAP